MRLIDRLLHRRVMDRLLRIAVVAALAALGLMVWSFFGAGPLPIVVFMTVGQAVGTLSFALFLAVILADLIRNRLLTKDGPRSSDPPPEPPSSSEESA